MICRIPALIAGVIAVMATVVSALLIAPSGVPPARAMDSAAWPIRDVSMTALTHDTVCSQYDRATMARLVGYVVQLHANFASDDVPYDDTGYNCTPGPLAPGEYLKAWADAIHVAGLHALFRGNWNHWGGDYGQVKLSYSTTPAVPYESSGGVPAVLSGQDTTSYIGMTYQWILHHSDVFQNGDIFEPFGEPQNDGIVNGPAGTSAAYCPHGVCQFPSTAAFNQWLSDFAQADQAAFRAIGKDVASGWFGLAGNFYPYVTQSAMAFASTYNVDHFTTSFSDFTSAIQASYQAFGKPMVIEWGDFQDNGAEPATANTTDQFLGWLAQQPYIEGEEYWQLTGNRSNGPEAAVDFFTGQLTPAGQVLAKWFGTMANPPTPTPIPTSTPTFTNTPTPTSTPTSTFTPIPTRTPTITRTPVQGHTRPTPTAGPRAARTPASRAPVHRGASFVQGKAQVGSGFSLLGPYARPVYAGDLLVGVFRSEGEPQVSDNENRKWVEVARCGVASIWYVAGARAGATRVLLTSTVSGQIRVAIAEYSGIARTRPLDSFACGSGTATTARTGSTHAVPSGDLAFAGIASGTYPEFVTAGSIGGHRATLRAAVTGKDGMVAFEDALSTTKGRQSAAMQLSAGGAWSTALALFKPF